MFMSEVKSAGKRIVGDKCADTEPKVQGPYDVRRWHFAKLMALHALSQARVSRDLRTIRSTLARGYGCWASELEVEAAFNRQESARRPKGIGL